MAIPPGSRLVAVGGQNGIDADGRLVAPNLGDQTRRALENVRSVLAEADMPVSAIVQVRISVVHGSDLHAGFAAWQEFWAGQSHQPLVSVVQVAALAVPGALVEIEALAAAANNGMNASARAMWADYLAADRAHVDQAGRAQALGSPVAFGFGRGEEMQTELAELVLAGTKRATAASVHVTVLLGEMMPAAGQLAVILDGRGEARCIIRSTSVHVGPLESVTDAFAWREGEGDRSRAYWLDGHRRFFSDEHRRLGLAMDDAIPVYFEEFEVVFPKQVAD